MSIRVKRVYEEPGPDDGYRVLVDRLWPRGLSKERAAVDEWLRDVAPSTALRQWYHHDSTRWAEFRRRYYKELDAEPGSGALARLRSLAARRRVTLVYSAQEETRNNATALRAYVERRERAKK